DAAIARPRGRLIDPVAACAVALLDVGQTRGRLLGLVPQRRRLQRGAWLVVQRHPHTPRIDAGSDTSVLRVPYRDMVVDGGRLPEEGPVPLDLDGDFGRRVAHRQLHRGRVRRALRVGRHQAHDLRARLLNRSLYRLAGGGRSIRELPTVRQIVTLIGIPPPGR